MDKYYNALSMGKEIQGAIRWPVLVIAGEWDQNVPLKTTIAAYEMIPYAQRSIPNAPHRVFLVSFPAAWACIVPFLKQ